MDPPKSHTLDLSAISLLIVCSLLVIVIVNEDMLEDQHHPHL